MTIQEKVDCYYCGQQFTVGDPDADEHWRECAEHPAREALDLAEVVEKYYVDIKMATVLLSDPFDQPIGTLEQCVQQLRALAQEIEKIKGIEYDSI